MKKTRRALDDRGVVRDDASLEELAAELRSVGIEPEEVLRLALEGEIAIGRLRGALRPTGPGEMEALLGKIGIRRDPGDGKLVFPGRSYPWDALRSYPHVFFSPTVAAFSFFAKCASLPRWSTDDSEQAPKRGVNFEDTTAALAFLMRMGSAALPPRRAQTLRRRESVVKHELTLARRHAALTAKLSREHPDPARRAWEHLADEEGIDPASLARRVTRAKRAHPDLDWPGKKRNRQV